MLIHYILITLNLLLPTCKVSDSLYTYLLRRKSGMFAKIFRKLRNLQISSSNRAMKCILNQSFMSHLVYLTWHDAMHAIHGSRAISTKKVRCGSVRRVQKRRLARQSYSRYSSHGQLYTSETAVSPAIGSRSIGSRSIGSR